MAALIMRSVRRSLRTRGQFRALSTEWGSSVPHGGTLVDRMVTDEAEKQALISGANLTVEITDRQSCDVEMIVNGGLSPIQGFMNESTYGAVVENMRLPDSNLLFGLPVVFDTDREDIAPGHNVLLTYQGQDVAVLHVDDKYTPNKPLECKKCYGTSELEHPGTLYVATERGKYYVGGTLSGLELPKRAFPCATPKELRAELPSKDGKDVVAFQCRNPVHRAHYELFMRALDAPNVNKDDGAVVLVHPTMGPTQADDISGLVRYETYKVLQSEIDDPRAKHDGKDVVKWAYLPYSMHMAGPREAIQHIMIRKNYGCTHFIIGRDMAGSKSSVTGEDYYGAYEAQDMANEHAEELGMQTVPSLNLVCSETEGYVTADYAEEKGLKALKLSGTKFRQMLRGGEDIPEWFAFKSVVEVLRKHQ